MVLQAVCRHPSVLARTSRSVVKQTHRDLVQDLLSKLFDCANERGKNVRTYLMRIKPKPLGECSLILRPFFWNQKRKYGAVLDAALLWARTPPLFLGVAFLYGRIDRRRSPIAPVLRSLVSVRVSQLNGCGFCVDINSATLMKHGVSADKLLGLSTWRNNDLFDDRERVVLDYAETVTTASNRVTDAQIDGLWEFFTDDAIVELTGLIAFQNMSSKFNSALGVEPQGFCRIKGIDRPAGAEMARPQIGAASIGKLPKEQGEVG
jgi:AhpD family alkylhydroperoxidase